MIPPALQGKTDISSNHASSNYTEAWALFTSQTLGNVTPNSVKFVRKAIEPILSPLIYQQVMTALEKQVEDIRDNHVTLYFTPRRILNERKSGKIFVHGQSILESPSGDRTRTERTYEFKFSVLNYMPSLDHMKTYEGKPRTVEELEMMTRLNNERARRGGKITEDN
jgi:conjugal transfer pilus assembly protein TraE